MMHMYALPGRDGYVCISAHQFRLKVCKARYISLDTLFFYSIPELGVQLVANFGEKLYCVVTAKEQSFLQE